MFACDDWMFVGFWVISNAVPNGGDSLGHRYSATPEGKFPRGMAKEVQENYHEVRKVKVKEVNGLYELVAASVGLATGLATSLVPGGQSFGR